MRDCSNYICFKPHSILPVNKKDTDLWFIYYKNELLVINNDNTIEIPTYKDIKKLYPSLNNKFYLGDFKNQSCFCTEIENIDMDINFNYSFINLRAVSSLIPVDLFMICGRASQLLTWNKNTQYCGRCATKVILMPDDFSKHCSKCGLYIYPRISPAIIVAITKGDEILLAHNSNFPQGLYSIISGFVDPCESLEACIKREVFEEVGIKVKNIKYFGSQPWPYPDSLMIGFFAEYDEGEIKIDNKEITDAKWFSKDNLPTIPEITSIARKIINKYLES